MTLLEKVNSIIATVSDLKRLQLKTVDRTIYKKKSPLIVIPNIRLKHLQNCFNMQQIASIKNI